MERAPVKKTLPDFEDIPVGNIGNYNNEFRKWMIAFMQPSQRNIASNKWAL